MSEIIVCLSACAAVARCSTALRAMADESPRRIEIFLPQKGKSIQLASQHEVEAWLIKGALNSAG